MKGPEEYGEEVKEPFMDEQEQLDSMSLPDDDDDDPRMHVADEVLDSESLLEMSGTIVQKINDLDIGTNIEKISNTISSTVRAVTEIISDLVQQSEDDSLPLNSSEDQYLPSGEEEFINQTCYAIALPEIEDEHGKEIAKDECVYYGEAKFPTEFCPGAVENLEERPCAPLNPTLSATSF